MALIKNKNKNKNSVLGTMIETSMTFIWKNSDIVLKLNNFKLKHS